MEVNYVFDEPALLTMNCHQLLGFGPAIGSHLKQQAIISRVASPLALTSSNRPLFQDYPVALGLTYYITGFGVFFLTFFFGTWDQ
jgi:hypothetical protein